MPTARKKEKNIVVEVKDRKMEMEKMILVPNTSVGMFMIGDHISNYLDYPHVVEKHQEKEYSYDSYIFFNPNIILWVEDNKIETICCKKECYWEGNNLIKMPFEKFLLTYSLKPNKPDSIYLLVNGKGQNQLVYEFDKFGLQIWVWRKKIVTVLVTNYLIYD